MPHTFNNATILWLASFFSATPTIKPKIDPNTLREKLRTIGSMLCSLSDKNDEDLKRALQCIDQRYLSLITELRNQEQLSRKTTEVTSAPTPTVVRPVKPGWFTRSYRWCQHHPYKTLTAFVGLIGAIAAITTRESIKQLFIETTNIVPLIAQPTTVAITNTSASNAVTNPGTTHTAITTIAQVVATATTGLGPAAVAGAMLANKKAHAELTPAVDTIDLSNLVDPYITILYTLKPRSNVKQFDMTHVHNLERDFDINIEIKTTFENKKNTKEYSTIMTAQVPNKKAILDRFKQLCAALAPYYDTRCTFRDSHNKVSYKPQSTPNGLDGLDRIKPEGTRLGL